MIQMGEDDRRESVEDQSVGFERLVEQFLRLDALDKRGLRPAQVNPGSKLEGDDDVTGHVRMSHQVGYLVLSAYDHLWLIKKFMLADRGLPVLAFYTLIRSSIEASSRGLWLLSDSKRDQRVIRALRMAQANLTGSEALAKATGQKKVEKMDSDRARLLAIRDQNPNYRQEKLNGQASITSMIEEADKDPRLIGGINRGVAVWIACSGIAHSNLNTALGLLELRPMEGGDAVSGPYEMTSSYSLLGAMFKVAMDFLEVLVDSQDRHNGLADDDEPVSA